eukprot:TRINITY_DN1653_c0_g1_i6.p3 TRINITY_DN1653_c0_g1~~TRINITY_DN1653_c0_g1_i6.p3  ORF type:complete len:112 (+),score=4.56 TRINITY_DN1653_c0_g1_i6:485-820(+)
METNENIQIYFIYNMIATRNKQQLEVNGQKLPEELKKYKDSLNKFLQSSNTLKNQIYQKNQKNRKNTKDFVKKVLQSSNTSKKNQNQVFAIKQYTLKKSIPQIGCLKSCLY